MLTGYMAQNNVLWYQNYEKPGKSNSATFSILKSSRAGGDKTSQSKIPIFIQSHKNLIFQTRRYFVSPRTISQYLKANNLSGVSFHDGKVPLFRKSGRTKTSFAPKIQITRSVCGGKRLCRDSDDLWDMFMGWELRT